MTKSNLHATLTSLLPEIEFLQEVPLAPLTTVKIGGPAEVFCQVTTQAQFIQVVQVAKQNHMPLTILGSGSNVLIADRGIRGLVVINMVQGIQVLAQIPPQPMKVVDSTRWQTIQPPVLNQLEKAVGQEKLNRIRVRIESGTLLGWTINKLLNQGITGLEWFAKIPGTIGGAIVNNSHGGHYYIGQFVESATVVDKTGQIITLNQNQLEFDYDFSRFHSTKEIIIYADFLLFRGNADQAKQILSKWSKQKAHQPQNSLGCVFKNLSEDEQQAQNLSSPSIGYVVDQILHLKGTQIGDAKISDKHGAFIENLGQATASDYLELIRKIIHQSQAQLNLKLKPEIIFLGFTPEELAGII
ncbi:MAG: FAD-binding protein [Patescibacteria group bacterium]|nr:FAD-binding protein [Patescibacteria group bacterium]